MISGDDIDAMRDHGITPEIAQTKIRAQARNVAYEFHIDYMFDLLRLTAEFGDMLSPEMIMHIASDAQRVSDEENNS